MGSIFYEVCLGNTLVPRYTQWRKDWVRNTVSCIHLQPKEKVQDAWKPSHVLKPGSLLHFALKAVLDHINGTWNGIRLHDHLLTWLCFPFSVGHAVRKWPFVLSRWTPESRLSCLENQVCWWDNMQLIVVMTETRHYSVFLPKGGAFTVHCLVCPGLMWLGNPFSSCWLPFTANEMMNVWLQVAFPSWCDWPRLLSHL